MATNNNGNKGNSGSNNSSIKKSTDSTEIRSTSVNPASGPKPASPARQPK